MKHLRKYGLINLARYGSRKPNCDRIDKLTYSSGRVGWQVACVVNGRRIRNVPTFSEIWSFIERFYRKLEPKNVISIRHPEQMRDGLVDSVGEGLGRRFDDSRIENGSDG